MYGVLDVPGSVFRDNPPLRGVTSRVNKSALSCIVPYGSLRLRLPRASHARALGEPCALPS